LLFCTEKLLAQTTAYKKKIKEGEEFVKRGNFRKALKCFLYADSMDATHADTKYNIGLCYLKTEYKFNALDFFKKSFEMEPSKYLDIHLKLGNCYQLAHNWDRAHVEYYLHKDLIDKLKDQEERMSELSNISKLLEECETGKQLMKKPLRVFIDNMGSEINSPFVDYTPVISADEDVLMYTSRRSTTTGGGYVDEIEEYYEDIYRSYKFDDKWSLPQNMGSPVNTNTHDATINLSPDGQRLLIYMDNEGEGNIWETILEGDKWSNPEKLSSPINSKYHETSAAYSFDGNRIYFVSYREGGLGGSDIYYVQKDKKGRWEKNAHNVGSPINTIYDEESVFLLSDGKTMFFSSKGHQTMGGFDVFKSTMDSLGRWSEPENVGYPINTADDDLTFVMAANGKHAYYSSVKRDGYGLRDLYMISYLGVEKNPALMVEDNLLASLSMPIGEASSIVSKPFEIKTNSVTLLKGVITDVNNKLPIEALITITDNCNGNEIANFKSNRNSGKFLVTLPSGKNYGIAIKAEAYLFHSENFDLPVSSGYNEFNKTVFMKKVDVGSSIVLKNVFYDVNKANIRNESQTELALLIKLMMENPSIRVEISSHTDNKGSEKYNLELSEKRSLAVVDYLVTHGIAASRLESKGYGVTMPISSNDTEEGRQLNRRTEFKILSK
jgi:outer membrane protein OmpA-like peptidoglycan-associated protein/tetratricopeptide (TPR) repeat protein